MVTCGCISAQCIGNPSIMRQSDAARLRPRTALRRARWSGLARGCRCWPSEGSLSPDGLAFVFTPSTPSVASNFDGGCPHSGRRGRVGRLRRSAGLRCDRSPVGQFQPRQCGALRVDAVGAHRSLVIGARRFALLRVFVRAGRAILSRLAPSRKATAAMQTSKRTASPPTSKLPAPCRPLRGRGKEPPPTIQPR